MKAIQYHRYGFPEVLQLREVEKPAPGDNEVLVKVASTTVTPVDCVFRRGDDFMARLFTGLTKPRNPVPGSELSGVVEEVGKDVTLFEVGDEIFGGGPATNAEYTCLEEEGPIAIKPSNLTFEEAAAVPYGILTALPFLRDEGDIQAGQRVLINGASGSIGTYAVQLAKHFGADVTGVCSSANVELVQSLGADEVIDYTREDFTERKNTWDVIFDTVGKSSFSRCKRALKKEGKYLTTVLNFSTLPRMMWTSIVGDKKAIFAATGLRSTKEQWKDVLFIKKLIEDGKLKPVIDRTYLLEQTAEAHRYVEEGHKTGNVVIKVSR